MKLVSVGLFQQRSGQVAEKPEAQKPEKAKGNPVLIRSRIKFFSTV